jgi:hypothetical protein
MALTDAETGTVYSLPISAGGFALPTLVLPNSAGGAAEVQYRKDSRLTIIRATPHADRRDAIPNAFGPNRGVGFLQRNPPLGMQDMVARYFVH